MSDTIKALRVVCNRMAAENARLREALRGLLEEAADLGEHKFAFKKMVAARAALAEQPVQPDVTVKSLIEECRSLNAGSMKIIARDENEQILSAVVVMVGHETAAPLLEAIETIEAEWEAEQPAPPEGGDRS